MNKYGSNTSQDYISKRQIRENNAKEPITLNRSQTQEPTVKITPETRRNYKIKELENASNGKYQQ